MAVSHIIRVSSPVTLLDCYTTTNEPHSEVPETSATKTPSLVQKIQHIHHAFNVDTLLHPAISKMTRRRGEQRKENS